MLKNRNIKLTAYTFFNYKISNLNTIIFDKKLIFLNNIILDNIKFIMR